MGAVIASWQVAATMSRTNVVLVEVRRVESMVAVQFSECRVCLVADAGLLSNKLLLLSFLEVESVIGQERVRFYSPSLGTR